MVRKFSIGAAVLAVLIVTASAVMAASPHYVQGPTVSASSTSLTISGKAAGLGNASATADASLTGSVDVFSRCYNRGGNKPQADNKQETIAVNQNQTFDVRNGQVTFSFTVSPLSTLTCPGNQQVVVESVSWNLTLTWPGFPSLNTTVSGSL
jgi:hypothetical protein